MLGTPRSEDAGMRRYPRHQVTSKKPIQPSSANSLTWAWNMGLPGESAARGSRVALALDHRVGEVARLEARAGRVVEEVRADVERARSYSSTFTR